MATALGPIDYLGRMPLPSQVINEGVGLGLSLAQNRRAEEELGMRRNAIAEAQKKAQEAEAARLAQEQELRAFGEEINAPGFMPTTSHVLKAIKFFGKEGGEALSGQMKNMSEAQQTTLAGQYGEVTAAALGGNTDLAAKKADEYAQAFANSGDEDKAKDFAAMAENIRQNPGQAALFVGVALNKMGETGQKVYEGLFKAKTETRTERMDDAKLMQILIQNGVDAASAQSIVSEREAKAKSAQASAAVASRVEEAGAVKAEGEALKAKAEGEYAPDRIKAELKLTDAQTAQYVANAKDLGARTAKTMAEIDALGKEAPLTPPEKMDAEGKLRKEYSDQTKSFQDVYDSWARMQAAKDDAVGDLSMIFGYMKALDPGSVVREGEFEVARKTAGIPDRVWNFYEKLKTGERLTESQRKSFREQGKALYEAAQIKEGVVRKGLTRIAKSNGLDVDNIFYETNGVTEPNPGSSAQTGAPAPTSAPVFKGWVK